MPDDEGPTPRDERHTDAHHVGRLGVAIVGSGPAQPAVAAALDSLGFTPVDGAAEGVDLLVLLSGADPALATRRSPTVPVVAVVDADDEPHKQLAARVRVADRVVATSGDAARRAAEVELHPPITTLERLDDRPGWQQAIRTATAHAGRYFGDYGATIADDPELDSTTDVVLLRRALSRRTEALAAAAGELDEARRVHAGDRAALEQHIARLEADVAAARDEAGHLGRELDAQRRRRVVRLADRAKSMSRRT